MMVLGFFVRTKKVFCAAPRLLRTASRPKRERPQRLISANREVPSYVHDLFWNSDVSRSAVKACFLTPKEAAVEMTRVSSKDMGLGTNVEKKKFRLIIEGD